MPMNTPFMSISNVLIGSIESILICKIGNFYPKGEIKTMLFCVGRADFKIKRQIYGGVRGW